MIERRFDEPLLKTLTGLGLRARALDVPGAVMVVLDWDGTVCDTPEDVDHDDASDLLARCQPRPAVVQRIREILGLGHDVAVVTGRGPHVAHATRAQADAWLQDLSPRLQLVHRPRLVFDWRHYVQDKERSIRDLRGDVYIGDRPEDRAAALRAGARFLWAHEFEAHGLVALRSVLT